MRKLKVSELVLDFDLYPRATVNSYHVGEMIRSLEAGGVELPPIVACKKTHRVVDGFHRTKAYVRLHGEAFEVDVVEKSYRTEKDIFLDAMRYNADHGLRMDTHDKAHCALKAAALGIDDALIAETLHVKPEYIGGLRTDRSAKSGKLSVPIKQTIKHMAGKRLTKGQVAANDKLSGMNQLFYVRQVAMLIENDLVDMDNEQLIEELQALAVAIDGICAVA